MSVQYDPALYEVDEVNQYDSNASLRNGAILYRIASETHWKKKYLLTGAGAEQGTIEGRFHRVGQRASYCANNALVCISEMLYHMYRRVLNGIKSRESPSHLASLASGHYRFVTLSVKDIGDMIYADCEEARINYDPRIAGSTVVFPDPTYEPLHDFSDALRKLPKKGVVYPSARHSRNLAFAFFRDETDKIRSDVYKGLHLSLHLISETQDPTTPPTACRPLKDKLHATMGFYEFVNHGAFASLQRDNLLNPATMADRGYVDFVRRRYLNYPVDAFRSC